jgi:hypothetical protein
LTDHEDRREQRDEKGENHDPDYGFLMLLEKVLHGSERQPHVYISVKLTIAAWFSIPSLGANLTERLLGECSMVSVQ